MQKMIRWRRTVASLLVMIGLLTSVAAACAAGASTPDDEQMACCQGGHHKCGPSGDAAECCKTTDPRPEQLVVAKVDSASSPIRALLLTLSPAQPLVVLAAPELSALGIVPAPERLGSSPPPYIAFSTLLI